MSALDTVKQFYQYFAEGRLPDVIALLDEDVEWELVGPKNIPYFGLYKTHAGVQDFFDKLFEHETVLEFEPLEFIADKDKVVVVGREKCRANATNRSFEVEWTQIFWLQDQKIVKWKEIIDTHAMVLAYTPD